MSDIEVPKQTKKGLSGYDAMESKTTEIIQKPQSKVPARLHSDSSVTAKADSHRKDVQSESEIFKNINIDQGILKELTNYFGTITEMYLDQVNYMKTYSQEYARIQESYLEIYENSMYTITDAYSKWLSFLRNDVDPQKE